MPPLSRSPLHKHLSLACALLIGLCFPACSGGSGDDFDCCDNLPPGDIEVAYMYVANFDDDTISGFEVDEFGDVEELPGSPYDTFGAWPVALAMTPDTDLLFVANHLDGSVASYVIFIDGEIVLSAEPVAVEEPLALAVHPTGDFLYVTNEEEELYVFEIDPDDGELNEVFQLEVSGETPNFVEIDPDGRFLYVSNSDSGDISGYSIDDDTGALTEMEGSPFPVFDPTEVAINDLVVTNDSRFLYLAATCFDCNALAAAHEPALIAPVGEGAVIRFAIDDETGELAGNGEDDFFATFPSPTGLAITPDGDFLYAAGWVADTVDAFAIDEVSGDLDPLSTAPYDTETSPVAVAVGADGLVLATANIDDDSVSIFLIDNDGELFEISDSPLLVGESPIAIVSTR